MEPWRCTVMLAVAVLLTAAVPEAALVRAPAPEAALAPAPTFAARLGDAAAIVAWPLSLDSRSTPAVAVVAAGFFLLPHDIRLFRFVDRKVRWTHRRRSAFDLTVHLGDGLVDLAVVGAFALGDARARRTSIEGVEALVSVAATSVLLKHLFRVGRPSANPDHKTYFGRFSHDAFPSGHTMSAFATATVIAGEFPGSAPYAYAAAALVGLSVMKRRWHWPSDVVVGAALGYLIGRTSIAVNARHLSVAPIPAGIGLAGDL